MLACHSGLWENSNFLLTPCVTFFSSFLLGAFFQVLVYHLLRYGKHALKYMREFFYRKRLSTFSVKREAACFVLHGPESFCCYSLTLGHCSSKQPQPAWSCLNFPTSVLEWVSGRESRGFPLQKPLLPWSLSWYIVSYVLPYCSSSQDTWEIRLKHGDPVTRTLWGRTCVKNWICGGPIRPWGEVLLFPCHLMMETGLASTHHELVVQLYSG